MADIPQYAPAPPAINENCLGQGSSNYGLNIIDPPQSGAVESIEVTEGFSIGVTDNSSGGANSFEVAYAAYEEVAVALVIVALESAVPKANPVLSGTIIDAVECDWTYNALRDGDIDTQSLVNTGAGADPTLIASDRDYDYAGLTLTTDSTVTITGSDPISSDNDVEAITFGNYLAVGVADPSLIGQDPDAVRQSIFDALATKTVKTSQAGEAFTAFGTATEYMVIAHPASWGESEFTKGSFTGGYKRIYWVNRGGNDLFVDEILGGDTVIDIDIDNGKNGFTENYFFYMSEYPARTGDQDTIISKK